MPSLRFTAPLWAAGLFAVLVFVGVALCFQLLDDDVERWLESFKRSADGRAPAGRIVCIQGDHGVCRSAAADVSADRPAVLPGSGLLLTLVFLSGEMALDYFLGRRFGKQWLDHLQQWLQGRSRFLDKMLNGNHLQEFLPLCLLVADARHSQ